jgi:hypothetical protein
VSSLLVDSADSLECANGTSHVGRSIVSHEYCMDWQFMVQKPQIVMGVGDEPGKAFSSCRSRTLSNSDLGDLVWYLYSISHLSLLF